MQRLTVDHPHAVALQSAAYAPPTHQQLEGGQSLRWTLQCNAVDNHVLTLERLQLEPVHRYGKTSKQKAYLELSKVVRAFAKAVSLSNSSLTHAWLISGELWQVSDGACKLAWTIASRC